MYWPELKKYIKSIDGSFFVPYFTWLTSGLKKIQRTRCTACLYGMLSRIIALDQVATVLLPESECKGKANFGTDKQIAGKISNKCKKNSNEANHMCSFVNFKAFLLIKEKIKGN